MSEAWIDMKSREGFYNKCQNFKLLKLLLDKNRVCAIFKLLQLHRSEEKAQEKLGVLNASMIIMEVRIVYMSPCLCLMEMRLVIWRSSFTQTPS